MMSLRLLRVKRHYSTTEVANTYPDGATKIYLAGNVEYSLHWLTLIPCFIPGNFPLSSACFIAAACCAASLSPVQSLTFPAGHDPMPCMGVNRAVPCSAPLFICHLRIL